MFSRSFHQYSWNFEIETTWKSLICWRHRTSKPLTFFHLKSLKSLLANFNDLTKCKLLTKCELLTQCKLLTPMQFLSWCIRLKLDFLPVDLYLIFEISSLKKPFSFNLISWLFWIRFLKATQAIKIKFVELDFSTYRFQKLIADKQGWVWL